MTVCRAIFLFGLLFPFALAAGAETLTIPAVSSLPAGSAAAPFFSDVRVFNSSYTAPVTVTAVYRCFLGACPAIAPEVTFTLEPRESRAFDDMVLTGFQSPSSAGAVELTSPGGSLRVTSRLYSTSPTPTVGMFVPGLKTSQAHAVSVLTSLANGAFRTNVGIYNGNDSAVTATIRLFDGAAQQLGALTVSLGPRSGTQINRIFDAVGQASRVTTNAWAVVATDDPGRAVFSYAAVIDDATSDPIFVPGAEDEAGPPVPQRITINVRAWDFSPGGPNSPPLTLTAGTAYVLVFHNVDLPGTTNPRHGFSGISELGLPATDDISPGHDFVTPVFTPEDFQRGVHPFNCTQNECGGDPEQHRGMVGMIIVQ
jgi:hypothetical protein